jgi:hypothetical protein
VCVRDNSLPEARRQVPKAGRTTRALVSRADDRQVLPEEGYVRVMSKTDRSKPAKPKANVRFVAYVTDPRTGKRRYASWYGLRAFALPVK